MPFASRSGREPFPSAEQIFRLPGQISRTVLPSRAFRTSAAHFACREPFKNPAESMVLKNIPVSQGLSSHTTVLCFFRRARQSRQARTKRKSGFCPFPCFSGVHPVISASRHFSSGKSLHKQFGPYLPSFQHPVFPGLHPCFDEEYIPRLVSVFSNRYCICGSRISERVHFQRLPPGPWRGSFQRLPPDLGEGHTCRV